MRRPCCSRRRACSSLTFAMNSARCDVFDIRGADGELADAWTDGLLFALGGPIYAGTNEIQRNIIAERLLGLPREKR